MKKLISISVVLALLAMMVLPVGMAAAVPPPPPVFVEPTHFSKIPFNILSTGLVLMSAILADVRIAVPAIPIWFPRVVNMTAPWVGGPLALTTDMMGWGLTLVGGLAAIPGLPLPAWVPVIANHTARALFQAFMPVGINFTVPPPR